MNHLPEKHLQKLLDIQQALALVKHDPLLLLSITNEIVFQWVPSILTEFSKLTEDHTLLQAEYLQLCMQNDEIIKQNILLSQKLRNQ
ncbi:MAG: hypothetical protein JWM44_4534 [Bacilli bacterium]|nr:hypothetical protein [Bacilli bacterium]